jgi:hypothetical protein
VPPVVSKKKYAIDRGESRIVFGFISRAMACSKPALSFADLVEGRDASVRVLEDDLADLVDLVMVVTGKNCNHTNALLRDLKPSLFDKEKICVIEKRRYVTLDDAIALIMVIPGKAAKHARQQFTDIIVRYLDGDRSMCIEIKENQAMGKLKSYSKFASKVMDRIQTENKKAAEIPATCYVYATKSPAFPGLIKIGKTINMCSRLSQLNTSCAPAPHVVVAVAPTFDHDRDEKTAHAFFASVRREGEFFELEDDDVIHYFATHITAQYSADMARNISALQGLTIAE